MNVRRVMHMAMLIVSIVLLAARLDRAHALSSSFTYQGQLQQSGVPVEGACDLEFSLWDAQSGGTQLGSGYVIGGVTVVNGLFTATLDFGAGIFTGPDRWLQIGARCPYNTGNYVTLSPRQQLTATPYALYAPAAGSAANLTCSGCVGAGALANNAVTSSSIAPNTILASQLAFTPGTVSAITAGVGLTGGTITDSGTIAADIGTTAGTVAAGNHNHDSTYWSLDGNSLTGTQFLGTTNFQALEFRVNSTRALRLEPSTNSDPNSSSPVVIGGSPANSHTDQVGVTIGGGGTAISPNRVQGDYGTVGGGRGNQAGDTATISGGQENAAGGFAATVGGGLGNAASELFSSVGGGTNNDAGGTAATISGGAGNSATGEHACVSGGSANSATGEYASVGGGKSNQAAAKFATIGGGGQTDPSNSATGNRVFDDYGTVGGGGDNQAGNNVGGTTDAVGATVGGGGTNLASGPHATVSGGFLNFATGPQSTVAGGTINSASGQVSTVAGGTLNSADGFGSFAAGVNAHATHNGSFVWGDGTRSAGSQGLNTFNALATGGFRFYFDAVGNHCDLTDTNGWQCTNIVPSDRNAKNNVAPVSGRDVLYRLAGVPIHTWSYVTDTPPVRHVGPMAQDFHAAFAVGQDDRHIDLVDANGVAMAAIQGLYQIVQENNADLAALRQQNAALEARIATLEEAIGRGAPLAPVTATAWNAPQP